MTLQTVVYRTNHVLSYAEYGNEKGFPILINHGLIASIRDGSIFHRLIEGGMRVICVARPGFGASSPYPMKNIAEWADIVSALIQKLNLSQFDTLGISAGAPYSYALGRGFPGQARFVYILSGVPALYDEEVLSRWPYPENKGASIAEMQKRARDLFFTGLPADVLAQNDIRDATMNDCYGVAQDMRLRSLDWGFTLGELHNQVFMRHSQSDRDVPFSAAELTARRLPNCIFQARETDPHFSPEVLDDFIDTVIFPNI